MNDDGIMTLREAAPRISVGFGIAEAALKHGAYNRVPVEVTRRGHRRLLNRAWVAEERLPALLDATWDYVLYQRKGKSEYYGPWVPSVEVRRWLKAQLSKRAHAARGEVNPALMTGLAWDLGIDNRRLYAWLKGSYQHIPYALIEKALWEYSCLKPEDICPREKMIISKPPRNRKEDDDQQ